MFDSHFSHLHSLFVNDFPSLGFEECLASLEHLEMFVSSPEQQALHDRLVEATYSFYEAVDEEDLGYEIVM